MVYGEWPDESVYQYCPSAQQVKQWIQQAEFELIEQGEGDSFRHLIVRKLTIGYSASYGATNDSRRFALSLDDFLIF